jgi:thiol:disulfide interchange protein
MRRIIGFILICWVLSLTALTTRAAHTQAQLILSASTAKPGDTILAAVHLTMETGWHTYWRNPGEAGQATEIKWQLPPGVTAGAIQWPLPKKLPPAEVTTYGYEDETVLIIPLTLDKSLAPGPVNLAAHVSWLECKDSCIPAAQDVSATLTIGRQTVPSDDALLITTWQAKVPKPATGISAQAFWQPGTNDDTRPLLFQITWTNSALASQHASADFFPEAYDAFEVQPDVKQVSDLPNELEFTKTVKKFSGTWTNEISGVLILPEGAFDIKFPITDMTPTVTTPSKQTIPATTPTPKAGGLGYNLLLAFIGGLILNLMPCVLPVIALKILGFVNEAGSAPGRVRVLALVYTLGVLASFGILAAIVIAVKAAGHQPAWGMQFGSPVFIVCLTTLVTLVALNLFGVFEVAVSGKAFDAAGNLASRHGPSGAFFNGVLATTLATPCTAPFLAPALGFAFAQPTSVIILIFLAVGIGLAAPYLILGWNPAWLKFLPRPGAWMEKFKIAMGFPMLATVVWLFNIAGSSYGKNVLWLGLFLTMIAFAAWVFGEFVQRGRSGKLAGGIIALLLLVGGYAFALEKQLDWRHAMPAPDGTGSLKESADGIDWQRWSPDAVTAARAAGKPVLVDFTADWCLTCQVNKKTSIEIVSVRKKLKDLNAVAMVGDYTHFSDNITAELTRYQRAGVPLVLVYSPKPDVDPIVLPAFLTPNIVLNALDQAAH